MKNFIQKNFNIATNLQRVVNLAALALVVVVSGCGEDAQIQTYTTAKHSLVLAKNHVDSDATDEVSDFPTTSKGGTKARMLGALVPKGKQTWFFKVTGPEADVAGHEETFVAFLKSVSFDGSDPKWELPENWTQKPGDGIRFATIEIPGGDEPLALSVTQLPSPQGGKYDEYVLANVNRWRGQLQQKPLKPSELDTEVETIASESGDIRWINISGIKGADNMRRPPMAPFANKGRPAGPSPAAGPAEPSTPTKPPANLPFEYAKPGGWQLAAGNQFSKLAFQVQSAVGENLSITVSDLAAGASALSPNINRWRGQVGLDRVSDEEITEQIKEVKVGDAPGSYVVLKGEKRTILGVIAVRGNKTWFLKAIGENGVAEQEQRKFEDFVKSFSFK